MILEPHAGVLSSKEQFEAGPMDDVGASYKWEETSSRTWEAVEEDSEGNIITTSDQAELRLKRARLQAFTVPVRRGLVRFVVLLIDCSKNAKEKDFRVSRIELIKNATEKFILEFFDQNPISQLCLCITRDRTAVKLSELSGNPSVHLAALRSLEKCDGVASIQNSLELAAATLKHVPDYGSKEIIFLFNSLSTCDPGNVFDSIESLRQSRVRVNVLCFAAEVYICRKACELTNGTFCVVLDEPHAIEALHSHISPPPDMLGRRLVATDYIYMGFPKRTFESLPFYSFDGNDVALSSATYSCPRCTARVCSIPTTCNICSLQLNSSSHIARSHHHLFPVKNFVEKSDCADAICQACFEPISSVKLCCEKCKSVYCVECDILIHTSLHNCPNCCLN